MIGGEDVLDFGSGSPRKIETVKASPNLKLSNVIKEHQ
jgi:hypothetical protein